MSKPRRDIHYLADIEEAIQDEILTASPELAQKDVARALQFADRIIEQSILLRADEAFERWKQDPERARAYHTFRSELVTEGLLDANP